MREDTVVRLRQPGTFSEDPLTAVLRLGARRLLAQAVEMEVTTFVEMPADLRDGEAVDRRSSGPSVRPNGRWRVVRHGYLPERAIQTGIGPVAVCCPRVRDRGAGESGGRVMESLTHTFPTTVKLFPKTARNHHAANIRGGLSNYYFSAERYGRLFMVTF